MLIKHEIQGLSSFRRQTALTALLSPVIHIPIHSLIRHGTPPKLRQNLSPKRPLARPRVSLDPLRSTWGPWGLPDTFALGRQKLGISWKMSWKDRLENVEQIGDTQSKDRCNRFQLSSMQEPTKKKCIITWIVLEGFSTKLPSSIEHLTASL